MFTGNQILQVMTSVCLPVVGSDRWLVLGAFISCLLFGTILPDRVMQYLDQAMAGILGVLG